MSHIAMPSPSPPNGEKKWSTKRSVRHLLGRPLQVLAYTTGAMALFARFQKHKGALILMYHSVADEPKSHFIDPANHVPAKIFERQMHFLFRYRRVVQFKELIQLVQKGKMPPDGTVAITFDDGYLDNLAIAVPVLDRFNLPATLFLPTAYIDRGENQWVDQVYAAFKYRTQQQLIWGTNTPLGYNLNDSSQLRVAHQQVCAELFKASAERRQGRLRRLCEQLQPSIRPPRLTMTWDEVRALISQNPYFEIGGHTLEHIDLTSVNEAEARRELTGCTQRIREETGRSARYFSFCYGRTSAPLRQLAAEAGFEAACGGEGLDPVIKGTADCYRLPRIPAPPAMQRFDLLTSSANSGIWRKLGH